MPALAVDPVFAEVAKALYGDVDVRELAKFSPGSSDLHINRSLSEKEAKRQKRVAQIGLGATGIATTGALHAIKTTRDEHVNRMAEAGSAKHIAIQQAREVKNKAKAARGGGFTAKATKVLRMKPTTAAAAIGLGWAGLHGAELVGDTLAARAQLKQIKQSNSSIKKGLRIRLKPLNALPDLTPSLRAKRPKLTPLPGNPRTRRGLYQPLGKRAKGIPVRRRPNGKALKGKAGLIRRDQTSWEIGPHRANKSNVIKAAEMDVTWSGEISKVEPDKRQVFGWASVSSIGGQELVDLQGDIVPIDEIEKSAYRYVIESRKGGDMHKRVGMSKLADEPLHTADMIESFVVTPEKLEKMGLPADALPHGWWVGFHVNDDAQWSMVKSGERKGFSIHGQGKRTPVSKREKDRGANLKERVRQAAHPPAVELRSVPSLAVREMGYQPQTRRLAVVMRSNPERRYEYRMSPGAAQDALEAPSKGRHYATVIRGKTKRAKGYTVGDRARLFLDPQVSKSGDFRPARNGRLPGDNRDAEMARSRRTAGLTTAGLGYLAATRGKDIAEPAAKLITRSPKKIGVAAHEAKVLRRTGRIANVSGKTGAALVGAGLLLAGEGALSDLRHRKAFRRTSAQAKEKLLTKAYDPERRRHARQDLYAGGAAGGAVVAGAGAVQAGRGARKLNRQAAVRMARSTEAHADLQNQLTAMRTRPQAGGEPRTLKNVTRAGQAHRRAVRYQTTAADLAGKARKLRLVSRGSAAGAAALGAAALGLHSYDRRRGGRSYAY